MKALNLKATAYALVGFAILTYALCAVFRALFPNWPMYQTALWQAVFPGFSWTTGGLLIGLAWSIGYALYAAVVVVALYNLFARRATPETAATAPMRTPEPHHR